MKNPPSKKKIIATMLGCALCSSLILSTIAYAETKNTTTEVVQVQETKSSITKSGYTGVIIDASGLGLQPTFSPVIVDENGRNIYGINNINPDFAISKGMVEYATDYNKAIANSRAGVYPLIIKAVAAQGNKTSANKINVMVSAIDGDRILLANEKSDILHNCSVVFIK